MRKLLFFFLLFQLACTKETADSPKANAYSSGIIKWYICSRGCVQYLLQSDQQLLMPDSLPPAIKKLPNGTAVLFSGTLLPDSAIVYRPAPDDSKLFDFKVRKVHLTAIQEK